MARNISLKVSNGDSLIELNEKPPNNWMKGKGGGGQMKETDSRVPNHCGAHLDSETDCLISLRMFPFWPILLHFYIFLDLIVLIKH